MSYGGIDVVCDLVAGSGASESRERGWTRLGVYVNDERGAGDVALNVVHKFGEHGGKFLLRCRADSTIGTAHDIRIMAMRVGTLTKFSLGNGTSSSTGSAQPEVVHGYRTSSVAMPASNTLTSVATIPLSAGQWWIRADLSVYKTGDGGVSAPYGCKLQVGDQTDDVTGAMDLASDSTMVDLNIAASVTTPRPTLDDVRLSCKSLDAAEVRNIRITAVKLGTLTQVDLTDSSSTISGSGMNEVDIAGIDKPAILAATRADEATDADLARLRANYPDLDVVPVSVIDPDTLDNLRDAVWDMPSGNGNQCPRDQP